MKKWGWPTFTQTNLFCSQTRIIGAWVQLKSWRPKDGHCGCVWSVSRWNGHTLNCRRSCRWNRFCPFLKLVSIFSMKPLEMETDFLNFQKVILHVRYLRYVRCWPFLLTRWNSVKPVETVSPCFAETALEDELGQNADGPLLCLVKRTGRPLMAREMLVAS